MKSSFLKVAALLLMSAASLAPATTQTLSVRISLATDDMERRTVGGTPELDIDSSDLEVGDDGGSRPNTVGLRFQGITIPAGATILSANIQFTGDPGDVATDVSTPTVVIRGHLNASPATFSTTNVADIVSRTTTTASVSWLNIPTWGPNIAGANERTPDLTSIVQEIIGLPGWTSGNPMAFIISESPGAERTAHSFEGNSAAAPLLTIQYVAPASAKDWEIYE